MHLFELVASIVIVDSCVRKKINLLKTWKVAFWEVMNAVGNLVVASMYCSVGRIYVEAS